MTYWNTKSTLDALRVSLICGVSATALTLSAGAANAQTIPGIDPTGLLLLENQQTGVQTGAGPNVTTSGYTPVVTLINQANGFSGATANPIGTLGTAQTGAYLIDTTTGNVVSPVGHFGLLGAADAGYAWVNATDVDKPLSYKWVQATYANANVAGAASGTNGTVTEYLVDANGKPAPLPPGASVNWTTGVVTGAAGYSVVPSTAPLQNLSYLTSQTGAYQTSALLAASTITSPAGPLGITSSTATTPGGVVYSNSLGQSTAIGPNGTYAVGNNSTWTNGAVLPAERSTTVIDDGNFSSTIGSNLTNPGRTTIQGGVITSTGAAYLNDVNVGGTLNVTGLASLNGGLNVTGGTTTDTLTVTGTGSFGDLLTTNGITNTGTVATDDLTSTTATIGTLNTTTINNTGAITSGSVKTGTLDVTGATTTNGITNTGNIATDLLTTTGNVAVGGTLGVTGLASLNGGAQVSNGLSVDGRHDHGHSEGYWCLNHQRHQQHWCSEPKRRGDLHERRRGNGTTTISGGSVTTNNLRSPRR